MFTISGITGGGGCSAYNRTYTNSYVSDCFWAGGPAGVSYGTAGGFGASGMTTVSISGTLMYQAAGCPTSGMVLGLISDTSGCTGAPLTIQFS